MDIEDQRTTRGASPFTSSEERTNQLSSFISSKKSGLGQLEETMTPTINKKISHDWPILGN